MTERRSHVEMLGFLSHARMRLSGALAPITVASAGSTSAAAAADDLRAAIAQRHGVVVACAQQAREVMYSVAQEPWPREWLTMDTASGTQQNMQVMQRMIDDAYEQLTFIYAAGFHEGAWFLASYTCRLCSLYIAMVEAQGSEWTVLSGTGARA